MYIRLLRRFFCGTRGNVAIIFGLSLVPMTFLVGMGVDYTYAALRDEQLSAAADSAALAAVTTSMMTKSDSASVTAATNTFNAQASAISGINYSPTGVTVTVTDSVTTRTVTVQYTSSSVNFFPSLLGMTTIPLAGQSQAIGESPPNINFYLLLDASPSMAIAATQSGINTMVSNTTSQGGCAFACHESHPSSDGLGNPNGEDNYTLARALGVTPKTRTTPLIRWQYIRLIQPLILSARSLQILQRHKQKRAMSECWKFIQTTI
jgi:Flp pilus assembly protein TadG